MAIRGKTIAGLCNTTAATVVIVAGITAWPKLAESWYVHRLETGHGETQQVAGPPHRDYFYTARYVQIRGRDGAARQSDRVD